MRFIVFKIKDSMNLNKNYCRVCLKSNDDLKDIFVYERKSYLPNIIYNISGVKVSQDREPEAKICAKCTSEVMAAERTILRCQESEEYLLSRRKEYPYNEEKSDTILETVNICHAPTDTELDITEQRDTEYITLKIEPFIDEQLCSHSEKIEPPTPKDPAFEVEQNLIGLLDCQTEKEPGFVKLKPFAKVKPTTASRNISKPNINNITHPNHYLHKCDYCDYKTTIRKLFIDHLLLQHFIDDDDIYPCPLCAQRFPWRRLLFKHIEEDHRQLPAEKQFMCDECGKTYTQEVHLLNHHRQHHEAECHKCPYPNCNSIFNRISSLRRHFNNLHTQLKPFHCTICDKHFSIWDNWSYHMDVVHQHTKITCPRCCSPFRNQKKLENHMLLGYCENWMLKCIYCKRRFPTKATLKSHEQNAH